MVKPVLCIKKIINCFNFLHNPNVGFPKLGTLIYFSGHCAYVWRLLLFQSPKSNQNAWQDNSLRSNTNLAPSRFRARFTSPSKGYLQI